MTQKPSSVPASNDGSRPFAGAERTRHLGLIVLVAAVSFAVIGLVSLAAVLVSAWMGSDPWPGFVAAAYFCLPLGFLLMLISVVVGVISRGRS